MIVGALSSGLSLVPDGVIELLFCRVPAEMATAWFGVPLDRATLTYLFGGQVFEISRRCGALGFFSIVVALFLVRCPKWCWLAYPITLGVNTVRIVAATVLTCLLSGFRYERLVHMALGAILFVGTLLLLWMLSERSGHGA